ncbi:alpha/beta fold hydrolase [Actinocorallia sp. A-T 12471]|uniref:alpha/beta fold hydrolase n=1 Tax=Actinocorallia sp. A-T 12471 TaxID=3089813 RepID=UPI0029CD3EAD|nr:alpha/beta fold hydrolase [Actinocorallia sp. A-T 12471]MDX6741071.1 alpha/beta fold hydrolase [Actinocorallia sp. A-T 12471]
MSRSDAARRAPLRAYAATPHGLVHYAEQGAGDPVLLLHQTPRSWDEYRDVLPLLGARYRAIAMDTLGFGASDRPEREWSVELFAEGVLGLCDALGLDRVALVGHHTGGVVATEVAARAPERVRALVLSGVPYVDAERRAKVAARPPIDHVAVSPDGAHLADLWHNRRSFYPADRPDLLQRLVRDALGVVDRVEEGHVAVNSYRMEDRIGLVRAPALVLCGELDDFSRPDMPALAAGLGGAPTELIPGVGVPAPDHRPDLFAAAVDRFLRTLP